MSIRPGEDDRMVLPADAHVHSEWSWDTGGPGSPAHGTMHRTCERAVTIGLPAVVFTEHLDFDDAWRADPADFPPVNRPLITKDGYLRPPPLEIDGYLESIERCRHQFPDLRILTGVEFGQPHLFEDQALQLLDLAAMDRVNGSLHTLTCGSDRAEPVTLFRLWPPDQVMEAYLDEVPRMVTGSTAFEVFTHWTTQPGTGRPATRARSIPPASRMGFDRHCGRSPTAVESWR